MGSWRVAGIVMVLAAGTLLVAAPAQAQKAPDLAHGKALAYSCLGCHGIDGYRNAYPNYSVPRLKGQHPEYIVAALQEYKSGQRSHATMAAQAASLSDQDMIDVAAYVAGTPLAPAPAPVAAVAPPAAVAVCTACHGATGIAAVPMYPDLAGQHPDYLKREIAEYKQGGRKNPIMAGMAATIRDEDVEALAQYYSRQTPALATLPKPKP